MTESSSSTSEEFRIIQWLIFYVNHLEETFRSWGKRKKNSYMKTSIIMMMIMADIY